MKNLKTKKSLSPERYFDSVDSSYSTDRLVMKSNESEDEFFKRMEPRYGSLEKVTIHQSPRPDGTTQVHKGPSEGCSICHLSGNVASNPPDDSNTKSPFTKRTEVESPEQAIEFVKQTPFGSVPTVLFSYENGKEHLTFIFDVVTVNTAVLWFDVSQVIKTTTSEIKPEIGEEAPFKSVIYPDAEIRLVDFLDRSKYQEVLTKIGRREWKPHITFMKGMVEVAVLKPSFTMAYMSLDIVYSSEALLGYHEYLGLEVSEVATSQADDENEQPSDVADLGNKQEE